MKHGGTQSPAASAGHHSNFNQRNETMFNSTIYRGYDIFLSTDGTFTILDNYGSGHTCDDLADCKATIDGWEA